MATLALQPSAPSTPTPHHRPKQWSFAGLLNEAKRYLWRYGTVTDVDTDPIELLQATTKALEEQEALFEKENESDSKRISDLEGENAKLKAELAAAKAKLPPWWKG